MSTTHKKLKTFYLFSSNDIYTKPILMIQTDFQSFIAGAGLEEKKHQADGVAWMHDREKIHGKGSVVALMLTKWVLERQS